MAKEPAQSSADARERNLKLALGQIEKEFGKGSIMRLGDKSHEAIPVISSGALSLDIAMGVGGFPRGRILEIYGPESSGKTTVCLHVVANAQKNGGICAFIDTEHALDPRYARVIGVNTDDLLISQPDCGEDALNIAETLVRSNALDVLIIDSVAALVPRAEIEGQMGDTHVGLQARLMSQALRKLTAIIGKSNTCVVFTNQIREKIGVMFGSPETTTGGRALKFYSSIRLEIRRIATIKAPDGQAQGSRVKVKVVKNKLAAPFQECEFDIMYSEGISRAGSLLDVALEMKIIDKRGSWFSIDDVQIGQGREQTKKAIEADPELAEKIRTRVMERLPSRAALPHAAMADDEEEFIEEEETTAADNP
ncbi:MAG TPA: recombinase RecA [Lentisphaeria bacterium]|nr:recombinase RecA [Lentisphaeria bacterium]HQL87192.1 recombinase RecA [Lentisphaeria bacterium]